MNPRIYLSSGAFRTRSLHEILEVCDAEGVRNVELSSGVAWEEGLDGLIRQSQARMRYLVHNYFPPPPKPFVLNLAAPEAEQLALSRAHCRRAIDLAADLGNPFYSVHSGFAVKLRPEMLGNVEAQKRLTGYDYEAAFAAFVESLRELCAHAAARGVRLLIENNVVASGIPCDPMHPPFLVARLEEAERLFAAVDHPALGLLFDVAHAKVSGRALGFDPREFMEGAAGRIAALHLSDNDGLRDTNQTFSENAWFADGLRAFRDHPMIIEVYRMQPDEMRAQVAVLDRLLQDG